MGARHEAASRIWMAMLVAIVVVAASWIVASSASAYVEAGKAKPPPEGGYRGTQISHMQIISPGASEFCGQTPSVQNESDVLKNGLIFKMRVPPGPLIDAQYKFQVLRNNRPPATPGPAFDIWWKSNIVDELTRYPFYPDIGISKSDGKKLGMKVPKYAKTAKRGFWFIVNRPLEQKWRLNADGSVDVDTRIRLTSASVRKLKKYKGAIRFVVLPVCFATTRGRSTDPEVDKPSAAGDPGLGYRAIKITVK